MIIGIDLGTTNSLAAYYTDEGPKIIPNRLRRLPLTFVRRNVRRLPLTFVRRKMRNIRFMWGTLRWNADCSIRRVRPASLNVIWEAGSSFIWVIKAFWLRNSPPLCSGR